MPPLWCCGAQAKASSRAPSVASVVPPATMWVAPSAPGTVRSAIMDSSTKRLSCRFAQCTCGPLLCGTSILAAFRHGRPFRGCQDASDHGATRSPLSRRIGATPHSDHGDGVQGSRAPAAAARPSSARASADSHDGATPKPRSASSCRESSRPSSAPHRRK